MSLKKKTKHPQESTNSLITQKNLLLLSSKISMYTNYDNIKNPNNFKSWWNTLITSKDAPYLIRAQLYENSLKFFPFSYKLWFNYLNEAQNYVSNNFNIYDNHYEIINNLYERSLIYMNKFPRIWLNYCEFLIFQKKITKTRKIFDESLKNLPASQHEKIWQNYLNFANNIQCKETKINIYKRYVLINKDFKEEFIEILFELNEWNLSLKYIIEILNDDFFNYKKRTKIDYWNILCEVIEKFPEKIINEEINVEKILRFGIKKYSDKIGYLWVTLANFYIKLNIFYKARNIFEEAINNVLTEKDFSLVYEAYIKFEQNLLLMENNNNNNNNFEEFNLESNEKLKEAFKILNIKDKKEKKIKKKENNNNNNYHFQLMYLDNLLNRREFLLNCTLLRQNSDNIQTWRERIKIFSKLYNNDFNEIEKVYIEALNTISPLNCIEGNLYEFYIEYAEIYKKKKNFKKFNEIYQKGINSEIKLIDKINLICDWIEKLLLNGFISNCLKILEFYCKKIKNLKLYSLYVDLLLNVKNYSKAEEIYDKMIDYKISNEITIFNYLKLLEKNKNIEKFFKILNICIDKFSSENIYDFYILYIKKYLEFNKENLNMKIEFIREIFNDCLENKNFNNNIKNKKIFYLLYSKFEENYGMLNNSIEILLKFIKNPSFENTEKIEIFSVLISKVSKYFGITKTRNYFNLILNEIDSIQIVEIGLKYVSIEIKLNEFERARKIFEHLSQFCNPEIEENVKTFWEIWRNFEINYGNVDTYAEMEKIRKKVKTKFSMNITILNNNN